MVERKFWALWIELVGGILVVFGLSFALFSQGSFFDLIFNRNIDPVFWSAQTLPVAASRFQSWIYGVLGATIAGWGVLVSCIARFALRRGETWAWWCLVSAFTLWFLVDTGLSASFGVTFNVLFNCFLLALVVLPLWRIRRHLR